MTTEELPQIPEIDDHFSQLILDPLGFDDVAPTIAHAQLLHTVFDQERKANILFDPLSETGYPWALDNKTDIQTIHLVLSANATNKQQFGTFSQSDFALRMVYIGVSFGTKTYTKQAIKALERTSFCSVQGFEAVPDAILSRFLLQRADEDYNYPPNLTAFAIYYTITDYQPFSDDDYES